MLDVSVGIVDAACRSDRRCIGRHQVGRALRQIVEACRTGAASIGFSGRCRLRQLLDARRAVELRPFGAQRRDRVLLAPDLHAQLGDALGLPRGFELDLVDIGRRQHERGDHADVEEAHHRLRLPLMTSASDGRRGSRSSAMSAPAGASVRSAARSLAERARGLAAISASSGDDRPAGEDAEARRRLRSPPARGASRRCAGRARRGTS